VIGHDAFPVEPWQVREVGVDLDVLAQSESLFALANGHIGVRGNLDEGEPYGVPGTYLNSFYEQRPLPYAEAGYGNPESGQTLLNVTNGKIIRLLVDDEPFDLRYGNILRHERIFDLRDGVLRRSVEWATPAGRVVHIRSTRVVSFTQRAVVAVRYEVEAADDPLRVVLQSELVANEVVPHQSDDPRVAAALSQALIAEDHHALGTRSELIHRTKTSGLLMAAAMGHEFEGFDEEKSQTHVEADLARTTVGVRLEPGQRAVLTKFVTYGWSANRSLPAVRDQVEAALEGVLYAGWDTLLADQRDYLDEFWDGADVEVDGDPAVQQAVRFGLFHVLQAGARAERRAIPSKGLTGPGYDGHSFWDTECFVLPMLTTIHPDSAGDALRWRHSTLDAARQRAHTLGLRGATFPWRTITGEECSAYWPAGTAAFHINADIAVAALRYLAWTGDEMFERECALPMLMHTARLWMSLGHFGDDSRFHIDGVTGPDEYSAIVDDNTYTNLMAARNLRGAARLAGRWPDDAAALDVTDEEIATWQAAGDAVAVPYDDDQQVTQQDHGSTRHEVWDFARSAERQEYPLLLNVPYFDLYRKQVVKQADLVLALHWCGDAFSAEEKARAFAYYERLTVRDSSLSACTQAIVAAEVGHLELAHDYLREASLIDLRDLEHNTRDGVHVASLAGAWLALVAGFGGMRDHMGRLSFAPRLCDGLSGLRFTVRWRGCKIRVSVDADTATYALDDGPSSSVDLHHHGKPFTLTAKEPIRMRIEPITPITPRPSQPVGREPIGARPDGSES
jgi:alpha,alpha-trehalose phosphorylase